MNMMFSNFFCRYKSDEMSPMNVKINYTLINSYL